MTLLKLVSSTKIYDDAVERWGKRGVVDRCRVADDRAKKVAQDLTCFPEDRDREEVETFVAHRFRQILIALGPEQYEKAKRMKPDALFCVMLKMFEKGMLI